MHRGGEKLWIVGERNNGECQRAGDKCLGECCCSGEEAAAISICRAETLDDSLVVMRNEMCDVEICYLVDLDTGVDLADEEEAAEETHEPALRTRDRDSSARDTPDFVNIPTVT